MIKVFNNAENLIISHLSDVDGLSPVILSIIEFGNIDYILTEPKELVLVIQELIMNDDYKKYHTVFITDLSFFSDTAKLIDKCGDLKAKIKHFDHHIVNEDVKDYSFVNSITSKNGIDMCATSNFYEYLINKCKSYKLNNDFIRGYVENVRSLDTYNWKKTNNIVAKYLANLYSRLGVKDFIRKFVYDFSKNVGQFELDQTSIILAEGLENQINEYIKEIEKQMVILEYSGYKFGAFISELYRTEVGNFFANKFIDLVDFILIYDPYRRTFSLRGAKKEIQLNEVAKLFHEQGGGHPLASGFPLDESSFWVLKMVANSQKNLLLKK